MRPGPRRLAQATPVAQTPPAQPRTGQAQAGQVPPQAGQVPPQTGQAPPLAGQAPPAAPPPSPDTPAQPPSPDAAPDAPAPAPDTAPAATAAASPSTAPTPEQPPPPGEDAVPPGAEVIVVTGSRIGDPLGKQAPVLMMSREDIERTGLTSIGDILQQLPVSGGALNGKYNSSGNFGYPPDGGGVGAGATEADLRYLGSKRVLVLVDGVRWVNGSSASGVSAATDLNTIPIGIIERIEVLEDGASPLYGSDAIAGVINIITRKELSGVRASAYTAAFQQGDGFVQKYDLSWGSTTGKLSTVVGGSYVDQRAVSSGDRPISEFPVPNVGRCTPNCSGTGAHGRVIYFDPNGAKHDLALEDGTGGKFHTFTNDDRFNFQPYNYAETPSQRVNIFSALTYKLSPDINVRGKATFNNRESINQAAPEPLTIGPGAHTNSRLDRIAVDATNPYNPFGFTFDPNTDTGYQIDRRPVEAGPRIFQQDVQTFYSSGGLDGHFDVAGQHFTWDATVSYGLNRAEQRRNNAFNSAKLQQALGPAYLGSDGRYHCGTAANPGDPNCVPFDLFDGQGTDGQGTITPGMISYTTFTEHDVSEQSTVDSVANLSGNLVKLPAGWIAAAVGVEHRRLTGFFEPDAVIAAGDGAAAATLPTSGHYSVNEAYGELRAPLIAGVPGAELVDIDVAGRVSDYSFLTPKLTGKVSGRWKPTRDLVLRGSYGSGFRAPAIGELFGSAARFNPILSDPCSDFTKSGISATVRQRCIDLGVPMNGNYVQANPQIGVTTGGNRGLAPETSTSLNLSLAYSPAWLQDRPGVDSVDLELAYYDVRLDSAIAALDAQLQLNQCVLGADDKACMGIARSPEGAISAFNNVLQNIGGINVRGVDLTLAYRMPRQSFGRLRATLQSSYLLAYETRTPSAMGFQTTNLVGTISGTPTHAFPRLKSNLSLQWLYKNFDVALITRYIHSVTERCPGLAGFPGTCSNPNPDDTKSTNKLGITVYNDVQVVWSPEFDHRLTVTAGVNNFTDRSPPNCYSCSLNGFEGATYDVPGVFGYLSATYHMQ
ncbi:MAG TPA: TonB-dependent receptor [Kofleriaceae bacterium]|nr:TonB-dependent receptor [Kofleriaceae bacterium]